MAESSPESPYIYGINDIYRKNHYVWWRTDDSTYILPWHTFKPMTPNQETNTEITTLPWLLELRWRLETLHMDTREVKSAKNTLFWEELWILPPCCSFWIWYSWPQTRNGQFNINVGLITTTESPKSFIWTYIKRNL